MFLFAIPIYRCSPERHEQGLALEKVKWLETTGFNRPAFDPAQVDRSWYAGHWRPWRFNEIVGFLEIELLRIKFVGELWFVDKRVSRALRNKRFMNRGKFFEYFVHPASLGELQHTLHSELRETIVDTFAASRLKRYHLDLENFDAVASSIDWRRLVLLCHFADGFNRAAFCFR